MKTRLAAALVLPAAFALATATEAVDLGIEARLGYVDFTQAPKSADALFGSSGGALAGLALRVDVTPHLFLRAGASYQKRTGERVFVADRQWEPFSLGHPLELRLIPVYLDAAYVFNQGAFRPYAGLGGGIVAYSETSTVAGLEIAADRTRPSGRVILGSTWGRGHVRLGAELAYALIPDSIGMGGVSKVYSESDLGGFSAVATLTWLP